MDFLAFDGEAINDVYVLIGNSEGHYSYNPKGLKTRDILEFLTIPGKYIRVFYGMNYDVNMLMYEVPKEDRIKFFHGERINYNEYGLQLLGKKILKIWFRKQMFTYFDVRGFWQGSFIAALDSMNIPTPEVIEWGKKLRGEFKHEDSLKIIEYNKQECILLVEMLKKLNISLEELEIHLRSWHGSGAIASTVLKKHKWILENVQSDIMPEPFECAYYGGRIETLQIGFQPKIYLYDINSAYPEAITKLPDLTGVWHFNNNPIPPNHVGVSFIEWDLSEWYIKNPYLPGVFPWRAKDGYIQFPVKGRGWYWNHEINSALKWTKLYGGRIKIIRSYYTKYKDTPFRSIVPEVYELRRKYKAANDGRQLPLKLELNSIYGKFAQRVGKNPYQCICWAGFITSYCRSRLLDFCFGIDPEKIVGFATDSIALTEPLLDNFTSKALGGLDKKEYLDGNIFLMPGLACYNYHSKQVPRVRGYALDSISWSNILDQISEDREYNPDSDLYPGSAEISVKLFVTNLLADKSPKAYGEFRCKFISTEAGKKKISPFDNYKREYLFHQFDKPYLMGRLDEVTWKSKIPYYYRGNTTDEILESHYKQQFDVDLDVEESAEIAGDIDA